MQELPATKPGRHDPEEMLEDALAEPVLTGESRIPEAQVIAAAFLVLAVGAAAHINAWLPLRVEPAALALHLGAALGAFALARRVLNARTELPAMACGILFAVHPLAAGAMQAGDIRILAATLFALLAMALTLAATDAQLIAVDMRRVALALLFYTAAALLYPPLMAVVLVLPLLHRVRDPRPAHSALPTVFAAFALLFVSVAVALPYLTETGGDGRQAMALFGSNLSLLLGRAPFAVWHPVPVSTGWLTTLLALLGTLAVIALFTRARNALGPAVAWVLALAAAVAFTLPLDAVPLESALYPTIAGLALALGAVTAALGRVTVLGPVAAVAATLILLFASASTYARTALTIEPLAPLRATVDLYPDEPEPRLMLAEALYQQARQALGADAFARGEAPVVLRAGDARSHLQAALRYTGEVLDTFDLSADAMYLQGKILIGLGRPEEAAEDLFTALKLAPWRIDIVHALGDAYAAQPGEEALLKAAEYYESAARRAPQVEPYHTAFARHLERSGMLGRLAGLERAFVPDAYAERVRSLHEQNSRVLQTFQGDAFNPEALAALAESRVERMQPQQAVYALHEALRRDPALTNAWRLLADLSVEAGEHEAFVEEFAGIPAAELPQWEERAVNYASAGHWAAAVAFLRNSLPAGAGSGAYWLRVADLAIATGKPEEAQEALDAAANAGAGAEAIAERRRRLSGGNG